MPRQIHHSDTASDQITDEISFDAVFRRYFLSLCYYAKNLLRVDTEPADLVMECFRKCWENRRVNSHPKEIRTLLYTAVRNACFDTNAKKRLNTQPLPDNSYTDYPSDQPDALQQLIRAESLRHLYEQAEKLPPQLKIVFQRFFIDGETEQTISEKLGKSYHTVRGQRLRIIEILSEKIGARKKAT